MALPLPKVLYDVGPGGRLTTSMQGLNALRDMQLGNEIKGIEAQYAPYTIPAQAASKLAYANLMGPQFLAKLLGNPDIAANFGQKNIDTALQLIGQAAMSPQGNPIRPSMKTSNSILEHGYNKIRDMFAPQQPQPQPQNAMMQPPSFSQNNDQSFGQEGTATPDEVNYVATHGNNAPSEPSNAPLSKNIEVPNNPNYENKFFERAGEASGIKSEKTELGKKRAEDINELDKQYTSTIEQDTTLNRLIKIINSPKFENLRKFPLWQDKQLKALSKIGTPEEQKLIGNLRTSAQMAVKEAVLGFPGRVLDKEVGMSQQMKIDENDTFNTMIGKLNALKYFNKVKQELSRRTSTLMEKNHLNLGDATQEAMRSLNTDKIDDTINNMLESKGFDPTKMLNYKYSSPQEFQEAFNTLGPREKSLVADALRKRRGTQ